MDRRTILHGAGAVLGVSAHSSRPSMKAVLSSLVHAFFVLVSLRPVGMRSNPVRVHGAASQDVPLCLGQVSRCTALWSCFTTCLSVSHLVDDDRRPVRRIGAADGRCIDLTPNHHGLCRHAMTADRLGEKGFGRVLLALLYEEKVHDVAMLLHRTGARARQCPVTVREVRPSAS